MQSMRHNLALINPPSLTRHYFVSMHEFPPVRYRLYRNVREGIAS